MKTACALCLGVLLASSVLPAQAPGAQAPPSRASQPFRGEVEAVEIDVRVVDEQGRPVRGLTLNDFELFENGVRQQVRVVTPVALPLPAPARSARALEPDVQSNRLPFNGRVYAFVLDDLHTHPLRGNRVKRVVRQFIDQHLGETDRAAIVVTSGRARATQELTASRTALLRALDAFAGQKLRSLLLERIDASFRLPQIEELDEEQRRRLLSDPFEAERAFQARRALTTLRDVARWLESVPARRKAIVFVSEGIEYDLRNFVEHRFASGLLADVQDAVVGARRSNTSIYAVDPRGLGNLDDENIELSSLPDENTDLGPGAFANALRIMQENLRILSESTGGFALVNTNDLAGGFDRIVRDNTDYYVLAYQPTDTRQDGRFRRVEVKVNRPGLRVIARRGYYAARKSNGRDPVKEPSPLKALLDSPLPVAGLPIDSHVAVFRGDDDRASALVTVEFGPGLRFDEQGALHRGRVDLAVAAVDQDGKVAALDDRGINLSLRAQTREAADRYGMRITTRLALKPGRYQIRVAAHDRTGSAGGSVLHDVDVPDYGKAPIGISSLVLGSSGSMPKPTPHVDPALAEVLKLPPTASRTFRPGEQLAILAELYDNRQHGDPVVVVATVADASGRVVFRSEDRVDPALFEPRRRAYQYRTELILRGYEPGEYVLTVTAQPARRDIPAVMQETPFVVTS